MNKLYAGWNPFCTAKRADPKVKMKMPQDQPAKDEQATLPSKNSYGVKSDTLDYEIIGKARPKSFILNRVKNLH